MEVAILLGFYFLILLYSIILHEVSHGVIALKLGDHTAKLAGRLTLNPKTHVDPIGSIAVPIIMYMTAGFAFGWAKPVPFNPYNLQYRKWGPVLVALAGPGMNFLLAFLFAISGKMMPLLGVQKREILNGLVSGNWEALAADVSGSLAAIVFLFCAMAIFWNVLLGIFNLFPIPPLDGSKLIFAVFNIPEEIQMKFEQWGLFILIGILFLLPMMGITFVSEFLSTSLNYAWNFFFQIML